LDRRRFLKYTGATAAVIGASALGLRYLSDQSRSIGGSSTSATVTSQATSVLSGLSTSTVSSTSSTQTVQLTSLQGRLFFDYNGNGVQDGEEPPVPDARVQLKQFQIESSTWKVFAEAVSDSAGDWKIEDVKTGDYNLGIVADPKYRHICTSAAEFRGILSGYDLSLVESTKMNIGLMEGFLTSPFHKDKSIVDFYVDLDPGPGFRDWTGRTLASEPQKNHNGTDFEAKKGTEVLAAAPGRVFAAYNHFPNDRDWSNGYWVNGNFVIIDHGNYVRTAYHHLDSIAVDETAWGGTRQDVKRSQVIGYVGNTSMLPPDFKEVSHVTSYHTHFAVYDFLTPGNPDFVRDPFRDLFYGKHGFSPWSNPVSFWTVDNKIQYPNP